MPQPFPVMTRTLQTLLSLPARIVLTTIFGALFLDLAHGMPVRDHGDHWSLWFLTWAASVTVFWLLQWTADRYGAQPAPPTAAHECPRCQDTGVEDLDGWGLWQPCTYCDAYRRKTGSRPLNAREEDFAARVSADLARWATTHPSATTEEEDTAAERERVYLNRARVYDPERDGLPGPRTLEQLYDEEDRSRTD